MLLILQEDLILRTFFMQVWLPYSHSFLYLQFLKIVLFSLNIPHFLSHKDFSGQNSMVELCRRGILKKINLTAFGL